MIMNSDTNICFESEADSRLKALFEFWCLPETFISWAMIFFQEGRNLNCLVDRLRAFGDYRQCLPENDRGYASIAVWKWHLDMFCKAAGWEWCPDDIISGSVEKCQGGLHWRDTSGQDVYGFYIRTSREGQ